jgi:NAD/NADP transhydrogenase alpha subunit
VLNHLPASHAALLTGQKFFPGLISQPFHHGLVIVFSMAIGVLVIAAIASAFRGGRYVHDEETQGREEAAAVAAGAATSGAGTDIVSDDIAADEADRESVRAADGRATPDA